jgi:hypothetical protein
MHSRIPSVSSDASNSDVLSAGVPAVRHVVSGLESVMYCVFCASAFRDLPHGTSGEVALATLLIPEHCGADASAIRP